MYTVHGNFLPTIRTAKQSRGKVSTAKRAQEVEAIRAFCSMVNPKAQAFHPTILKRETPPEEEFPRDFKLRAEFVGKLIEKTYGLALEQHRERNLRVLPHQTEGPLPNKIVFGQPPRLRNLCYTLSWTSSGNEIKLILTCFQSRHQPPTLRIIGWRENQVKHRADLVWIARPITMTNNWYGLGQMKRRNNLVSPKQPDLQNLINVKVPLGDVVEFLKKYQK